MSRAFASEAKDVTVALERFRLTKGFGSMDNSFARSRRRVAITTKVPNASSLPSVVATQKDKHRVLLVIQMRQCA